MQNYLTDKLENDAQIHNDIVGNDLKVVPYNFYPTFARQPTISRFKRLLLDGEAGAEGD